MATNFGFRPMSEGDYYFVSYNSQDTARVGEIAREMNGRGIPLWYDEGLLVGEKWERQIARQIENCRAVILFVTKKLMAKENSYVKIEYAMATGYRKKIYVIFLDHVTFDDVTTDLKGWWLRLNELHGVPVSGASSAGETVDIMDSHISFIRNLPEPETVKKVESAPAPVQKMEPKPEPAPLSVTKPIEDDEEAPVFIPFLELKDEQEAEPVHVLDYEKGYIPKSETKQYATTKEAAINYKLQTKQRTQVSTQYVDTSYSHNGEELERHGIIILVTSGISVVIFFLYFILAFILKVIDPIG